MELQELVERSWAIRQAYHDLEVKHHDSKWTVEEDLLALSNDIGNFQRLVMTKQGRYQDETPYTLEHKLSENIWWLVELSQRLEIDILTEMENFLSDKEKQLNIQTRKQSANKKSMLRNYETIKGENHDSNYFPRWRCS